MVISRFSLMRPVARGDGTLRGGAIAFFKKRARRILPAYYFAMAFSLLLIFTVIGKPTGTHWDVSLPVTIRTVGMHVVLLQNFSRPDKAKINHVFWSISLEWWIYFLFPALVLAWKRFGAGVTTVFSLALVFMLCKACLHFFGQIFILQYIALFIFGMLASEMVYTKKIAWQRVTDRLPWGPLAAASAVLFAFALTGRIPRLALTERSDVVAGVAAMCLLVMMALRPNSFLVRAVSLKPLVFMGGFAYSIYLIHAPVIQVVWQYCLHPFHLSANLTFLLLIALGSPVIIAAAYLFHLAFERPFMSRPGQPAPRTERQAEVAAIVNPAP